MRTFPYVALSLVLTAGISAAATYTIDFEDPAYTADADPGFEGVDGWVQSHTNEPPELPDYFPYAWISTSFASGNSLTYGGLMAELPDGFTVGRTFTGLTAGEKSLSFQNHITDTLPLDPEYPTIFGRDTFGFQVRDSGGDLLLTVNLVPVNQDYTVSGTEASGYLPGQWRVEYAFGTDTLTTDNNAIQSTGINYFGVDFGADGLTFNYGQGSSATHSVNGTATGYDVNDTELELTFTFDREGNGENHIRVDNINVIDGIPEPTTAALVALGGLALLRRRRAH
jgi:hypothetical protein